MGRRKLAADKLINSIKDLSDDKSKYLLAIIKVDLDDPDDLKLWSQIKNNPTKYQIVKEKLSLSTQNKASIAVIEFKDFTKKFLKNFIANKCKK